MLRRFSHDKLSWVLSAFAVVFVSFVLFQIINSQILASPYQKLNRDVEVLNLQSSAQTIESVIIAPEQEWQAFQAPNLWFARQHQDIWIRFDLNGLNQFEDWLIEVANPMLDGIELWFVEEQTLHSDYRTGDSYPFRARAVPHERFLFPIPKVAKDNLTVYMRVDHEGEVNLPLNLWRQQDFMVFNGENNILMGLFLGFMLAMSLSNFFFFLFTRSLNFLLYCSYAIAVAMLLLSLNGLSFKYFWPQSVWMQQQSIGFFANATLTFAILFIRQLVSLKQQFPKADQALKWGGLIFAIGTVASLFIQAQWASSWFFVFVLVLVFGMLFSGLFLTFQGLRVSKVYVAAWLVLLFSAALVSMHELRILHLSISSAQLLIIGASIETVLLALLLAKNFAQQSKDLLTAKETALEQEKQIRTAREEVIDMQSRANEELEYKVQERTLELEVTLRELAEKNKELEEKNTLDALTGIRNRRYFDKRYQAEVRRSRREQTKLSIAMLDIDHFKQVNDNYGHLVGDECIRHVANVIKSFLKRPMDEVCRYGGEEFAILMPATDKEGALILLEKIRQQIELEEVKFAGGILSLTASIGFSSAIISSNVQDEELLDTADQALYQAKQSGRNQVAYGEISDSIEEQSTTEKQHASE